MGELVRKKIPASTIMEVLVSLIVIMIVFTLAIGIFSRIVTSGYSLSEKDVVLHIEKILNDSRKAVDFSYQTIRLDGVDYQRRTYPYLDYKDLVVVEVKAERNGKRLGILRQVMKK